MTEPEPVLPWEAEVLILTSADLVLHCEDYDLTMELREAIQWGYEFDKLPLPGLCVVFDCGPVGEVEFRVVHRDLLADDDEDDEGDGDGTDNPDPVGSDEAERNTM